MDEEPAPKPGCHLRDDHARSLTALFLRAAKSCRSPIPLRSGHGQHSHENRFWDTSRQVCHRKHPRMHTACSSAHVRSHFDMHVCRLHSGVTHSFLHLTHAASHVLEHSARGGAVESSGVLFGVEPVPASTTNIIGGGAAAVVGSGTASVGDSVGASAAASMSLPARSCRERSLAYSIRSRVCPYV